MSHPDLSLPLQHLTLCVARLRAMIQVRLHELKVEPLEGTHDDALAALEASVEALEAFEAPLPPGVLPLQQLAFGFGLDPTAELLFLVAAAPTFDPFIERLYARLSPHPDRAWPSLGLLQVLAHGDGVASALTGLVEPSHPLMTYKLVRVRHVFGEHPVAWQPLWVDERMVRFLRGEQRLEPELEACVTWIHELPPERGRFLLSDPERDRWEGFIAQVERCQGPALAVFRGPHGIGRRRRAFELARRQGRALLVVDLAALHDAVTPLHQGLQLLRREAVLQRAELCLMGWEELTSPRDVAPDDPGQPQVRKGLLRQGNHALSVGLGGHRGVVSVILDGHDSQGPALAGFEVLEHSPQPPDRETLLKLWKFVLPRRARAPELDVEALAATFRLTPGQIHEAVEAVRIEGEPIGVEALYRAIKGGIGHRLGRNARLVERAWSWGDLVLPAEVRLALQEFVHRFRHRDQVFEGWQMGRRFGASPGLSALFEGPPGTGKTMSAAVIANSCGLDLYQVDLSRVVSRFIGETEKNLAHVFDEAELAQAMLLFDEADALFSKRTEVKSSNDRYANMEVNYLLQRLESFSGVVILTTNFGASIDDAFARRLSLRVTFPTPGPQEREALWRHMLHAGRLPLGKLDTHQLAQDFNLSGGHIRNVVLRAAFLAASHRRPVDNALVSLAARLEMRSQGMLVSEGYLGDEELDGLADLEPPG